MANSSEYESEANLRDLADIFGPGSSRPVSLDHIRLGLETSVGAQTIKGLLAIRTKELTLKIGFGALLTKEAWSILADFQRKSHSLQLEVDAHLYDKHLHDFCAINWSYKYRVSVCRVGHR